MPDADTDGTPEPSTPRGARLEPAPRVHAFPAEGHFEAEQRFMKAAQMANGVIIPRHASLNHGPNHPSGFTPPNILSVLS